MNTYPYRENGPILSDLQGEKNAIIEGKKCKIYIFNFRNREVRNKERILCSYRLIKGGKLNKEVNIIAYIELMEILCLIKSKKIKGKKAKVKKL